MMIHWLFTCCIELIWFILIHFDSFDWIWWNIWLQAHVVSAFEQSLSSMTNRLQSLTLTAEQKVIHRPEAVRGGGGVCVWKILKLIDYWIWQDNELQDLRRFIEQIRKSGGIPLSGRDERGSRGGSASRAELHPPHETLSRQLSNDSVSSLTSQVSHLENPELSFEISHQLSSTTLNDPK